MDYKLYVRNHTTMKLFATLIYFATMVSAIAQAKMAPLPSFIIICTTNQSAPVTIILTSAGPWREDYVKQESVITNLHLTCMSAKSVTTKTEKETVLLVIHDATSYGPSVVDGKYGRDQRLQTIMTRELSVSLLKDQLVQVNNEILSADRFAQEFKIIPERNAK